MNNQAKKKLKIVLIVSGILILPIGYLLSKAIAIKIHDDAIEKAMVEFPDDRNVIKESINQIDKAIRIYPGNYIFWGNKAELQIELNDYRGALISAKRGTELKNQYPEGLGYIGLIYEFLNQPDSAKIYYSKAIDRFKERKKNNRVNYSTDNQIALFYTFINQKDSAQKYLSNLPDSADPDFISSRKLYEYYLENYKTGGLKDFLYGETINMVNDSITDLGKIDSLVNSARIYYNGYETSSDGRNYIFEFREIFRTKAELIGFKRIE